jgi:hypothetical protein
MTTDSVQTPWTVQGLLDLFDVQPDGENRFIAETGPAGEDQRQVVEGTQVLAKRSSQSPNAFRKSRCARYPRCSPVPSSWAPGRWSWSSTS